MVGVCKFDRAMNKEPIGTSQGLNLPPYECETALSFLTKLS